MTQDELVERVKRLGYYDTPGSRSGKPVGTCPRCGQRWPIGQGCEGGCQPAAIVRVLERELEAENGAPGRVEAAAAGSAVEFTSAAEVPPRPVRWFWKLRVPLRAATLLAGPGGLGKSTATIAIAAQVTRGELDGDFHGRPATVAIASTEDTAAEVLVPRLMAANAHLDRVVFPRMTRDGRPDILTLPDDLELLEQALIRSDAKLVVLDPLVSYVGAEHDTHRDHHIRRVLAPLAEVADRLGLAVVAIVHVNKKDTREVLDRVAGSVGFVNACRSVLVFGRHPDADDEKDPRRVLGHAKSNWGVRQPSLAVRIEPVLLRAEVRDPIGTSRAVIEGESDVRAEELFGSTASEERQQVAQAVEFVAGELAEGPRPVEDVRAAASRAGMAWRTVERAAREKLRVESRRQGFGGKYSWSLPGSDHARHMPAKGNVGEHGEQAAKPLRERDQEPGQTHARQLALLGEHDAPDDVRDRAEELARKLEGDAP